MPSSIVKRGVAWMHGIDEKRVCEWKKQRTGLEKLPTKKKCLDVRKLNKERSKIVASLK